MSTSHHLPPINATYTPEPRTKKKVPARGYSLARNPKRKTLLTDHQVKEARWLHEFDGWTRRQVAEWYGLSEKYVVDLMRYQTRSKLFVNRSDFPPGYKPSKERPC